MSQLRVRRDLPGGLSDPVPVPGEREFVALVASPVPDHDRVGKLWHDGESGQGMLADDVFHRYRIAGPEQGAVKDRVPDDRAVIGWSR